MIKFAFIMRGVPGSGKSTTAQYLAGDIGVVHAVDDYHTDKDDHFWWCDDCAEEYYQQNFEAFKRSCQKGLPIVVCDNINVSRDEYQKYVECAARHGYVTSTVVLKKPDPMKAAHRNEHNVTIEQIKDMYDRWED